MKIVYLVNFYVDQGKGLGMVTGQKVKALRQLGNEVVFISSPYISPYLRVLYGLILDFKAAWVVVSSKPEVIISRGFLGFVSMFFAKLVGTKSVREVHAYGLEEVKLLKYGWFRGGLLRFLASFSHFLDVKADVRIFNHPDLMEFYKSEGFSGANDFYVYNGFDGSKESSLTKADSRKKYGLSDEFKYLIFTGSATRWHGIEYLVDLQKELIDRGVHVKVVCGGGDISNFDPDGVCLNITPLDSSECADLIKAADLCLLPVRSNRVSPGSPLKLYDYIVNRKFIAAQDGVRGYCDEVQLYNIGVCVNFEDSKAAADSILNFIDSGALEFEFPNVSASWNDRMAEWVCGLNKVVG